MARNQDDSLWRTVLRALENERCLDLRYRSQNEGVRHNRALPNYKIMKQLALRKRLGVLYRPFLLLAQPATLLVAMIQWIWVLLASLYGRRPRDGKVRVIATTQTNVALIESTLTQAGIEFDPADELNLMRLERIATQLRPSDVLHCASEYVLLVNEIIRRPRFERRDLILHSHDAVHLLLLARYARVYECARFATDDHYQRWAYLLSHSNRELLVVQHGFLDGGLTFKNAFGVIHLLFVRDESFVEKFSRHYKVHAWTTFSVVRKLENHSYPAGAVFLASSFPWIDQEIEFVRLLRSRNAVPIIVKFHPSHHYDQRKEELSSMASAICPRDIHPVCRAFVSYNSFMEYDYKALGIPTFSIARCGHPKEVVEAVVELLGTAREASL